MVLGEVRMAHRERRQDGRPHILPIRVRYDGPLDYELDSYLARVQYVRWQAARRQRAPSSRRSWTRQQRDPLRKMAEAPTPSAASRARPTIAARSPASRIRRLAGR